MKTLLFCLISTCYWHWMPAQHSEEWSYKGEKEGIKIYHRQSPGMYHIKLSTSLKVPLAGIVTLFSDVSTYTAWGYKMTEARLLRRVSDTEMYYYARYDFPWPMDDRDIILHSVIEQDPKTREIRIVNTPKPDFLPPTKGVVRIYNTQTQWRFVPGNDGWIYIEQQIATDSANDMPDWLIQMTVDTGPRETAKNIRKILKGERFQRAALAYIRE